MHKVGVAIHSVQGDTMTSQLASRDPAELQMLRLPAVKQVLGDSFSTIYRGIAAGTFPKPIELGPNRKGWPRYEVECINRARIAGKSTDDISAIVQALEAARRKLASQAGADIHAFVAELIA